MTDVSAGISPDAVLDDVGRPESAFFHLSMA
jgi:hypothetical protein